MVYYFLINNLIPLFLSSEGAKNSNNLVTIKKIEN